MLSHTTWLISKMDPVKYIFEKLALTGRITRWQVLLSEFDIVYVTQKVIKGSALADYLAQQALNDYQPMHPEFPDEDIMALFKEKLDEDRDKWTVWFDGASNVLGHAIGGHCCLVGQRARFILSDVLGAAELQPGCERYTLIVWRDQHCSNSMA